MYVCMYVYIALVFVVIAPSEAGGHCASFSNKVCPQGKCWQLGHWHWCSSQQSSGKCVCVCVCVCDKRSIHNVHSKAKITAYLCGITLNSSLSPSESGLICLSSVIPRSWMENISERDCGILVVRLVQMMYTWSSSDAYSAADVC